MKFFQQAATWARAIKRDTVAVYLAARDPRTPLALRILAVAVAAYALSPIDLIPDFIPILGYLDDVLIIPVGLWFVMRRLPPEVLAESRAKASALLQRPKSPIAGLLVVIAWLLIGAVCASWLFS